MKRFSIPEDKIGELFAHIMNNFGKEVLDYILPGEYSSDKSKKVLNYKMREEFEVMWDKYPKEIRDFFEALPQVPRPSSFLLDESDVHEMPEPKEDPSGHDVKPARDLEAKEVRKARTPKPVVGDIRDDGAMFDGKFWRPAPVETLYTNDNNTGVGIIPSQGSDRPDMNTAKPKKVRKIKASDYDNRPF